MHTAKAFPPPDLVKVRRALISVTDKTGLEAFARALVARGVEILSTGGTAKALASAGVPITTVDRVTGFPEILDGRVKTLHPAVHGGLLAVRDDPAHAAALEAHGIAPIDLVCINLYPFEQAVARAGTTLADAIENIDVGGPAMVRAGAKNHAYVAVLTSPAQYGPVLAEMEVTDGCTSLDLRRQLAREAFGLTGRYDSAIAVYLAGHAGSASPAADAAASAFPSTVSLAGRKLADLRYGENPHQAAAVYVDPAYRGPSVIGARQLHGKELSYNNLHDAAAALDLVIALAREAGHAGRAVAAACIKHANPCGAAIAEAPRAAVDRAIAGDPLAAFGGIIAVSGTLDAAAAERLCGKDVFLEVLLAEAIAPDALEALKARWTNLRILEVGPLAEAPAARVSIKAVRGGLLAQEPDTLAPDPVTWTHKAGPTPTRETLRAAAAIEIMVRSMNSNAVAIGGLDDAGGPACVRLFGGGLGQVDRLQACRIAVEKAGHLAKGAIAVSDAFFPFPDGPQVLIDAGVKALVHPGGSKRDEDTFALCRERGVTCLVTGVRRFKH